jgi:hypothetical protein
VVDHIILRAFISWENATWETDGLRKLWSRKKENQKCAMIVKQQMTVSSAETWTFCVD